MQKRKILGIATVLALMCNYSWAGLVVKGDLIDKNRKNIKYEDVQEDSGAGLIQIGSPTIGIEKITGGGKSVKLITALKMIVPDGGGWKAKRVGGVDVERMVDWSSKNQSWIDVLQDLGYRNNLMFVVNWGTKEMIVAPRGWELDGEGGMTISKVIKPAKSATKIKENELWSLTSSMTLKENVENWIKLMNANESDPKKHWQLSWGAVNYAIESSVELKGKFDDEVNGPFAQLVDAYKDAKQPIAIEFYRNNVVRVKNATFKPVLEEEMISNNRILK